MAVGTVNNTFKCLRNVWHCVCTDRVVKQKLYDWGYKRKIETRAVDDTRSASRFRKNVGISVLYLRGLSWMGQESYWWINKLLFVNKYVKYLH